MKTPILLLTALLLITPAFASGPDYTLSVKGVACPYCAFGVEKQLYRIPGVDNVVVDIGASQVRVIMADGAQLTEAQARSAVEDAGFTLQGLARAATKSAADEVFVADARNGRIQVFDKQGRFRRAFGQHQLARPMNLTIASGRLYVPDYLRDDVQVFRLAGDHQRTIRSADGLDSPGGVAVRADGSLLVADTYGQRIVALDVNGTGSRVLRSWGTPGVTGFAAGRFNYPTAVAVAPDGGFHVTDGYNDRIQQFDAQGRFVRRWGGPFGLNIFGPFNGWFATVTSVAVDPRDGMLFVADFCNDRIQAFAADGAFLAAFGPEPDAAPGHSTIAVAVDGEGTVFAVNFKADRVEVWRRTQ